MQEQVVLEVGVLGEAPRTDVTLEGPRTGMDVHVRTEIARRREGFTAETAFVGLVLQKRSCVTC